MHVTLYRCHEDAAAAACRLAAALRFQERHQVGHCTLHHARALDHLGEEHLARGEEIADAAHAGHQRAFDYVERLRRRLSRFLDIQLDEVGDAMHQCVGKSFFRRGLSPGEVGTRGNAPLGEVGDFQQPLGRVTAPVPQHVRDPRAQFRVEIVGHRQLARVDDPHVQPGGDGPFEEDGVNRLTNRIVAAKRERHVADAAAGARARTASLGLAHGSDKRVAIIRVRLDAGSHGKHVGIEDHVLWREPDLVHQQPERPLEDVDSLCHGFRLAAFVECHHNRGRAVAAHQACLFEELRLALLERQRVDDPLSLEALEPCLDDAPAR